MVGSDAVILCKAQNIADGNAVDDLSGRKPIDLFILPFSKAGNGSVSDAFRRDDT